MSMLKQFRPFHTLDKGIYLLDRGLPLFNKRGLMSMLKQFRPFHTLDNDFIYWITVSHPLQQPVPDEYVKNSLDQFIHWIRILSTGQRSPLFNNRGLVSVLKQFRPFHTLDKDFIHRIAVSTL